MMWDIPSNASCGMEVSGLSLGLRCFLLMFWVAFFFATFRCAWVLMDRYWPRFRNYDLDVQGDNCSRVNSTLHTLIVIPCLLHGIRTMSWSYSLEAQKSSSFLQSTLLVSSGYLLFDLYCVVAYRVPMWTVFTFHHIVAVIPFLIYYFTCCNYGIYILAFFMLVEITNVPLNAIQWLQDTGNVDGLAYPILLHLTGAMWVVFRLASPVYCMVVLYRYYLPGVNYPRCLWPAQLCGVLVNLFCFAGFFTVILKDIVLYWRRPMVSAAVKHRARDIQIEN